MTSYESVNVNTLLQLNATVLVGVFVFISIFPLAFTQVNTDTVDFSIPKRFNESYSTYLQILTREKSELQSQLNKILVPLAMR
jgi:hypothetical protein